MIKWILNKIVGSKNQREVRKLRPVVKNILEIEESIKDKDQEYLVGKTREWQKYLHRLTPLELPARGANISNVGLYYAEPLMDKNVKVKLSDVSVESWKTVGIDASAAIDGNRETVWKAEGLTPLVVDMGKEEEIAGFCYAPVVGEDLTGTIYKYHFCVSNNGQNWIECATNGEFSNIMHNPIPYFVRFGKTYKARYFKLEPLNEINGEDKTSVGDVGILLK